MRHATITAMRIEILLYDGFDELDGIAPYEVLRTAEEFGAGIHAELVGAYGAGTVVASHGTRIQVAAGLSEDAELVLVPGGAWNTRGERGAWAEAHRGEVPAMIAAAHERGARIASVCTGAMLLATAGLTDVRPATTHHCPPTGSPRSRRVAACPSRRSRRCGRSPYRASR